MSVLFWSELGVKRDHMVCVVEFLSVWSSTEKSMHFIALSGMQRQFLPPAAAATNVNTKWLVAVIGIVIDRISH